MEKNHGLMEKVGEGFGGMNNLLYLYSRKEKRI